MDCYACDKEATERCSRCGNAYCREHGDDPASGAALCAECLDPANATPSGTVFRVSVLALLFASVLALWLILRPPSLPSESSGVVVPTVSPVSSTATPGPTPSPATPPASSPGASPTRSPAASPTAAPTATTTPEPAPEPIEYTVVEGDTWFGIAEAFGVDAENLAAVNGLTLDDIIVPGDILVIPQ